MSKDIYTVPIRLRGETAEKINTLSKLLVCSIEAISNKLISSIVDEAIDNSKKFLEQMDDKSKKQFLEIFNGTLKELNGRKKK